MTRQFWALAAVGAVVLAAGCASDPTSSLNGTPGYIETSLRSFRVNVGDSVRVTAELKDAQGVTLPTLPSASSADANIATVSTVDNEPLSQLAFYVYGEAYGVATVLVTSGGITDSITVTTYPAAVGVTGAADNDTLGSGSTVQLGPDPQDAAGNSITVDDTFEWESDATTIVSVDSTGLATAKAPGRATITVTAPGGAEGTINLVVEPGTFTGTLSANNGSPSNTISITKSASGPIWDSDSRVFFNGVRTFIDSYTSNAATVVVPGMGATGSVPLNMEALGPDQVALATTFTSNTASLADQYDATNDNAATSPVISASDDYYVILSGPCSAGAGAGDCDDFFTITNAGATAQSVTVRLDWYTGADVDILWRNAANTGYVGNFAGATGANPETSTVSIPAATTYRLWVNLYTPGGAKGDLVRVRVTFN